MYTHLNGKTHYIFALKLVNLKHPRTIKSSKVSLPMNSSLFFAGLLLKTNTLILYFTFVSCALLYACPFAAAFYVYVGTKFICIPVLSC